MVSMVCRLMPNGSSPIKASPDSLRRMRLYFGVKGGLALMDVLRNPFANDEKAISVDLSLLAGEHFLDGLLVVLDEWLAEQSDLAEKLVERALDHPGGDLGRLAGFSRPRRLDVALARHDVGRNIPFGQVSRFVERDMHGDILA